MSTSRSFWTPQGPNTPLLHNINNIALFLNPLKWRLKSLSGRKAHIQMNSFSQSKRRSGVHTHTHTHGPLQFLTSSRRTSTPAPAHSPDRSDTKLAKKWKTQTTNQLEAVYMSFTDAANRYSEPGSFCLFLVLCMHVSGNLQEEERPLPTGSTVLFCALYDFDQIIQLQLMMNASCWPWH